MREPIAPHLGGGRRRRCWLAVLALGAALGWLASAPAQAAIDPFEFEHMEQQQQYRTLIAEFRCPKCFNQNLAESDAPIAQDLRRVVYELVQEGRSSDEIRGFMQERYGDFVLYRPPLRADTLLLWFGPLVLGLLGVGVVWRISRQRSREEPIQLDATAQAEVDALLGAAHSADPDHSADPGKRRAP
jgi:cytochrome c-type biogenesis protein CcmH